MIGKTGGKGWQGVGLLDGEGEEKGFIQVECWNEAEKWSNTKITNAWKVGEQTAISKVILSLRQK